MMTVTYDGGKKLFNVDAIKNDGESWLLYNAFTGVPAKVPARLRIVVSTQAD